MSAQRPLDLLELIDAAAQATALLNRSLARIGIGCEELRVLSVIGTAGQAGLPIGSAAGALSVSSSTALRRVRPLEKLGWLEACGPMRFALTTSGRELEAEGADICADASERLRQSGPGATDQGALNDLLAGTFSALRSD